MLAKSIAGLSPGALAQGISTTGNILWLQKVKTIY